MCNPFVVHYMTIVLLCCVAGMVAKVYPVMLGDFNAATQEFTNYFASGSHPNLTGTSQVNMQQ
jgi:hypothetical protein